MCPLSPRRLLARLRKLSGYRAERFLRHLELFLIVYIYFRIKSLRPIKTKWEISPWPMGNFSALQDEKTFVSGMSNFSPLALALCQRLHHHRPVHHTEKARHLGVFLPLPATKVFDHGVDDDDDGDGDGDDVTARRDYPGRRRGFPSQAERFSTS